MYPEARVGLAIKRVKKAAKMYCTCRKPDDHKPMAQCEGGCKEWFHYACVGITGMKQTPTKEGKYVGKYICDRCTNAESRTVLIDFCQRDRCLKPITPESAPFCSTVCRRITEYMECREGWDPENRQSLTEILQRTVLSKQDLVKQFVFLPSHNILDEEKKGIWDFALLMDIVRGFGPDTNHRLFVGEFKNNLEAKEKEFYTKVGLKVPDLEGRNTNISSSLLFCALGAVSRMSPTHYITLEPLILTGNPPYEFSDEKVMLATVQVRHVEAGYTDATHIPLDIGQQLQGKARAFVSARKEEELIDTGVDKVSYRLYWKDDDVPDARH